STQACHSIPLGAEGLKSRGGPMAVLFDPADEFVRSVLDRAKVHGEISLADLEGIIEGGLEAVDDISTGDIGDTIEALAELGIEVDDGMTPEMQAVEDAEFLKFFRAWEGSLPQLTAKGCASILRAAEREKAAKSNPVDPRKAAEEEAAAREALSK